MQQQQLVPVLNAKGVAAFPQIPLQEGMLCMWRSTGSKYNDLNDIHSGFVFDWYNCYFFVKLTKEMIDFVPHSPWLVKPIMLFQCGDFEFSQPEPERCAGFPIQFNPRRNKGYHGVVWGLEAFGDTWGRPGNVDYLQARCSYLNQLHANCPDIQFPKEVYFNDNGKTVRNPLTQTDTSDF